MIENIGKVILNYDYYTGQDFYSDGSIEDELLEIVKNKTVDEYDQIIYEKASWPILYHLSHIRNNILSWYPISKNETILEVGSGCGAITGMLSEKAGSVTCIELSKKRSLINAYRNKDRENISIIVGNFQDIESSGLEKYDVITLIGVLEYAGSYIESSNPYMDFLKIIAKHLNPQGKIIVAIENRLGLKYWAGCIEDHVGLYYEGIEGYPRTQGIKTFSKIELENLINNMEGFSSSFYYPYPDYKLPMIIYSDTYLPKIGDLDNNRRNFDHKRIETFNEKNVFDSLITNNLFPQFANSFLVEIKKNKES